MFDALDSTVHSLGVSVSSRAWPRHRRRRAATQIRAVRGTVLLSDRQRVVGVEAEVGVCGPIGAATTGLLNMQLVKRLEERCVVAQSISADCNSLGMVAARAALRRAQCDHRREHEDGDSGGHLVLSVEVEAAGMIFPRSHCTFIVRCRP